MIYIANDHAGYELKLKFIKYFKKSNIDYVDLGCDSNDSVDYPTYGFKLGEMVANNPNSIGVGICGSGVGISIACNKIKGVRAANINNELLAELSKKHNDANIICFGSRFVSFDEALKYFKIFTSCEFEGERHQNRINLLNNR